MNKIVKIEHSTWYSYGKNESEDIINSFQSENLEVEVQYASPVYDKDNGKVLFSAMIIGREKSSEELTTTSNFR